MEGPLSKWTNVIEGWQYRWFVLDETAGILTYYTSKEKMTKGERRGCVRLKGAVMGIDDEDDSTFTITVDQKMFHFQARDADERDRWIRALESTIQRLSGYYRIRGKLSKWVAPLPTMSQSCSEFERRISEADAYLQLMIDQIKELEQKMASRKNEDKEKFQRVIDTANAMLESVKHSIVLLQMTKNQLAPNETGISVPHLPYQSSLINKMAEKDQNKTSYGSSISTDDNVSSIQFKARSSGSRLLMPVTSYSSSDEEEGEEFFDTVENSSNLDLDLDSREYDGMESDRRASVSSETKANGDGRCSSTLQHSSTLHQQHSVVSREFINDSIDFDAVYDDDQEDELEDVQEHGSVVMHLLSQLSVGMDLTKIVLPTFILERRSLLEMFADFFAHPDLFTRIADTKTAEDRMVAVLKWYLSSFHAGRKSSVAKKPYNPILGETFHCHWNVPGLQQSQDKLSDGPVPGARKDQLTFIAEQVSHHPPISAFYAEIPQKNLQLDGHIWTKSKFLGLSIGVHMLGQACLSVLDHGEEYIITFPSGYGRSILTTPWVELGGKCTIKCEKTGYNAVVEFLTKPFYGGKPHCIKAEAFRPNAKTPFLTVKGLWNGQMCAKVGQTEEVFLDVHQISVVKKIVKPIGEQGEYESRKLWRYVTANLKEKKVHVATKAKQFLEQKQRNEAKVRQETGAKWDPRHFQENGEHWIYRWPYDRRAGSSRRSSGSSAK